MHGYVASRRGGGFDGQCGDALRRPELGSRKPGSAGDATLISVQQGQFDYLDVVGEHLIGERRIVSEGVVIGGRWWHPKQALKSKQLAS